MRRRFLLASVRASSIRGSVPQPLLRSAVRAAWKRRHPFEHEGLPSGARYSKNPACSPVPARSGAVTLCRPSSELSAGRDFASRFRALYASCSLRSATWLPPGWSEGMSMRDALFSEVEVRWNACGQESATKRQSAFADSPSKSLPPETGPGKERARKRCHSRASCRGRISLSGGSTTRSDSPLNPRFGCDSGGVQHAPRTGLCDSDSQTSESLPRSAGACARHGTVSSAK